MNANQQIQAIQVILDKYDQGERDCEPEDSWRLYRDIDDLFNVVGSRDETQP